MNLTEQISQEINIVKDIPNFAAGDTLTVYYKIREGNKERIQFFKGVVIQRKGTDWYEVDGGRQDYMNYFMTTKIILLFFIKNKILWLPLQVGLQIITP